MLIARRLNGETYRKSYLNALNIYKYLSSRRIYCLPCYYKYSIYRPNACLNQLQITDRIEIEPSVKLSLNVLMSSLASTAPAVYNNGK